MMKDNAVKVMLLTVESTQWDCAVLRGEFVWFDENEPDNISTMRDYEDDEIPLHHLMLRSQWNTGADPRAFEPYGWSTEYSDIYAIDLNRAEIMVKTLKTLNKKLAAYSMEWGWPTDLHSYIMRVCKAFGVKTVLVHRGVYGKFADSYRTQFVANRLTDLASVVWHLIDSTKPKA